MEVALLYFDGCRNYRQTDPRLREALAAAGRDVTPVYISVTSPEDAGQPPEGGVVVSRLR